MNILELTITDSVWIKHINGLIITFHSIPDDFRPKVGDAITLEDPNYNLITTTIGGIERWMRAIDRGYPGDSIGILLNGFSEYVDMKNWKALFVL